MVDGCGRVAGVVSSSYIGERGSEGLHFVIAEPTMSEKLIALGLRGYRIAEAGAIPDEAEIGSVGTPGGPPTPATCTWGRTPAGSALTAEG